MMNARNITSCKTMQEKMEKTWKQNSTNDISVITQK